MSHQYTKVRESFGRCLLAGDLFQYFYDLPVLGLR